ncbi:hypothetical protein AVEN_193775-1 [Araneus ventricosus]|uniref:TIL domain-containing protein n=1 Tax=Araneus ventricosus TaxID=182803 RepID=A0A4Y2DMT9_ARAVE|nr:hypothetical protein AVEN_193775-1 [Araneus ventricosus]
MKAFFILCVVALALFGTISGKCEDNKHYNECASACPKNCQNKNDPPGFCPEVCVPRCDCDKGYVFLGGASGQCVKPHRCP